MKHVAVLWWLLIYWSGELVAKSRILQTQVIGHLTERLPTLRGGIQGQSSLSQSEYSAPEPPKLEKLNSPVFTGTSSDKSELSVIENRNKGDYLYFLLPLPEEYRDEARGREAMLKKFRKVPETTCD